MRRMFVLILVLALLQSAVASAARGMSIDRGIERGFAVADALDIHPNCWPVTVRWATPDDLASSHDAEAVAVMPTCVVAFNPDLRSFLRLRQNASQVCADMVHELGHLSGLGHSLNPRSVMHAPPALPHGCARRGEVTWRFG